MEKNTNGEGRRSRSVLSERGRSERLPLLQSYSLCLGCFFIRMSRQTSPIGSLLSAVCLNVKAIGENGGGKETSERPKRIAVMSWTVDLHRGGCVHTRTVYTNINTHTHTVTHTHK